MKNRREEAGQLPSYSVVTTSSPHNPSVQRTGASRWDHYVSASLRRPAPAADAGRSMKALIVMVAGMLLAGCGRPPAVSKATHISQVKLEIAKAGGVTNVVNESRTLFARLDLKRDTAPFVAKDECLHGLSGLTNLGDVFFFEPPDHVRIRIHNSHFDTYFIALLNPDLPAPANFVGIAGNVGFIEPNAAANQSQPVASEPSPKPVASGSGR